MDGIAARSTAPNEGSQLPLKQSGNSARPPAPLDGEAHSFLSGFRDRSNRYWRDWLPRYRETIEAIEQALSDGRPQDVFDIIWRTRDNSIANAGQGVMNYQIVDTMREDLIRVIRDIREDADPVNFERIVERFEGWRAERRIDAVPRLMIARAFAGVHPRHYHTTVHGDDQDTALEWFVDHTGLAMPASSNWAIRAQALVNHLNRQNLFGGEDVLVRNMFPWSVVAQLRGHSGPTPRPDTAFADIPASQRTIELRHNRIQAVLFKQLAAQYGEQNVWIERATGTGGFADIVARQPDCGYLLYEIKIAETAAEVIRQAMGQLLEYSFRAGGLEPVKLFAVGEPTLDKVTREFIERLRNDFRLNINYLQVELLGEGDRSA
ncbi:hypothetical protein [Ralstonia pseudosolanacearum]|uniref:hypothetical protein n=1 Tax=Ralstonia pseudosolanacearum TaxID=1310165 RepID=UPI002675123D|nr:hypothetical protein [Ralstonia pseudosolanacearum]MDO3560694.1 hypothetical protein [Ralstonia pseudosolanacearum]MDO3570029.1 hypothetical protein [Ralstonia pseudosolanacearum]